MTATAGRSSAFRALLSLALLAMPLMGARDASGAVIPVTTVNQKISVFGGCSLQEAIYSANFDSNVAIAGFTGSTPRIVTTECVPGSGDDIIVLPAGAVMQLSNIVDDAYNPAGPTATPIITSKITILAYGATLERNGGKNFRLFAVAPTGSLTISRAYVRGFRAKGGDAYFYGGGGGGLGAGGAIFNMGELIVEASTFEANAALGGKGGVGFGGGGGGIGGNGGPPCDDAIVLTFPSRGGTGGGGARGNGAPCLGLGGGGGGGTLRDGYLELAGFDCGGDGGSVGESGDAGRCPGGGGGGGSDNGDLFVGYDGGGGQYGGGGGGGGVYGGGDGARGGFGGGGGASGIAILFGLHGGNGGFGGGGGARNNGGITDGDGGHGGFFAGNAGSTGGGGGAGLGGAIFNESGNVTIKNSTFARNVVSGGYSDKAQDGITGGGAIFSVNGHLTVLNSTITGHIAHVGSGILVAQVSGAGSGGILGDVLGDDSELAPTSFVLENTIIAGNGQYECAITGTSIGVAFAGNLIQNNVAEGTRFFRHTFVGCGGVVSSADPQLGPLQYNQGATPTMAISSGSAAFNTADPATSLPVDQRRQVRPEMGGYDIGAFELCLTGFGKLQQPCPLIVGAEDPGQSSVQLTMQVQPAGGGITSPPPGTKEVPDDSVVALKATPKAGYRFVEWSPNVTSPGDPSTTIFMTTSQIVTANFASCACATDVTTSIAFTYGGITLNPTTRRYVQTVTLKNKTSSAISGPISLVLDNLSAGVTLYGATGTTSLMLPAGRPYMNANVNLAAGQSVSIQLQFANSGNAPFTYQARVLAGAGSR